MNFFSFIFLLIKTPFLLIKITFILIGQLLEALAAFAGLLEETSATMLKEQKEQDQKRLAKLNKSLAENNTKKSEKANSPELNEQLAEADERLKIMKKRRKERLLKTGIEVSLGELNSLRGQIVYQGRQVILYKKEQDNSKIAQMLQNTVKPGKFHITKCKTIQRMKNKVRYYVTNDTSGIFHITGTDWKSGEFMEGKMKFNICRNCLTALNYKDYNNCEYDEGNIIYFGFSISEFFNYSEKARQRA